MLGRRDSAFLPHARLPGLCRRGAVARWGVQCDFGGTRGKAGIPSGAESPIGDHGNGVPAMGGGEQRCVWEKPVSDPSGGLAVNKKRPDRTDFFASNRPQPGLTTPTAGHLLPGGEGAPPFQNLTLAWGVRSAPDRPCAQSNCIQGAILWNPHPTPQMTGPSFKGLHQAGPLAG